MRGRGEARRFRDDDAVVRALRTVCGGGGGGGGEEDPPRAMCVVSVADLGASFQSGGGPAGVPPSSLAALDAHAELFARSDVVLGAEGQALAHALFLPPHAVLAVLLPRGFDAHAPLYCNAVRLAGASCVTTIGAARDERGGAALGLPYAFDYWGPSNDVLDVEPSDVEALLWRALQARVGPSVALLSLPPPPLELEADDESECSALGFS